MEGDFIELVARATRRSRFNVVDVTGLKQDGKGARIEPDNPRGDRVCFKYRTATVCANSHEKLDMAEKMIQGNQMKLERLIKYHDEMQEKLDEKKRLRRKKAEEERATRRKDRESDLGDLPYISSVLSKKN